jgi:hypothetical protein
MLPINQYGDYDQYGNYIGRRPVLPLSPLLPLSPQSPLSPLSPIVPVSIVTPDYKPYNPYNPYYPYVTVYNDLNNDSRIHRRMVKFFQMKTLDKWLLTDMLDVLNYLKVDQYGKVDVINSMNEYRPNSSQNESQPILEKKVDFIQKFFLTSSVVNRLLHRYVRESGTQWVQLTNDQYQIRKEIFRKLMKLIKAAIATKGKH